MQNWESLSQYSLQFQLTNDCVADTGYSTNDEIHANKRKDRVLSVDEQPSLKKIKPNFIIDEENLPLLTNNDVLKILSEIIL